MVQQNLGIGLQPSQRLSTFYTVLDVSSWLGWALIVASDGGDLLQRRDHGSHLQAVKRSSGSMNPSGGQEPPQSPPSAALHEWAFRRPGAGERCDSLSLALGGPPSPPKLSSPTAPPTNYQT
jgi:hypothetical protein